MLRYIGLLLLVPLLDALLLVVLVPFLGWQLVILLVVLTALVGLLLARVESRNTIKRIQQKLAQGEPPTDEVIDGGLLLVAGAFLLTPGLVTDSIGFLLIVPLTRYPIRWVVKRRIVVPYLDEKSGGFTTGQVYVGGFPGGDPFGDAEGSPPGGAGPAEPEETEFEDEEGETIDFDDARDVDFEDIDESGEGEG
jgi:UPF0716 protein FxsA